LFYSDISSNLLSPDCYAIIFILLKSEVGAMNLKSTNLALVLVILIVTLIGCSRGNPVVPIDSADDSTPAITDSGQQDTGSPRSMLGTWQVEFDIESMTASVTPTRSSDFHLNILPYIDPPDIYINSWDPVTETVDVDVYIHNTSKYPVYDVRAIIFTDDIGHKLLNQDNYTHMYDIPGGTWANGFRAFAKDKPQRLLRSLQFATENLKIKCPDGNFNVKFVVDGCWPQNCFDPYMMNNFQQGMLQAYEGASTDISVDVFDWQDNVDSVRIQCSAITGETDTYMTHLDGVTWGVDLVNNNAVPAGDYFALIAATSPGTTYALIDMVQITVTESVGGGYVRTWGGYDEDSAFDIALDSESNIYIVGSYQGTIDFNPDPGEEDLHTSANGEISGYLVKYDKFGDYQWGRTWDAEGESQIKAVGVNSEDSVFIGVSYSGGVYPDGLLVEYNSDGDILWQCSWNSIHVYKITFDNQDNILLSGECTNTTDFDPSDGVDSHPGGVFLMRFDNQKNYRWAATWGSWPSIDIDFYEQICDDENDIYLCGKFQGNVDFDHTTGVDRYISNGSYDAYVCKHTSDGGYCWTRAIGGPDRDNANDMAFDSNQNLQMVGSFRYTVDFENSSVG
jgi:hypothetical protein